MTSTVATNTDPGTCAALDPAQVIPEATSLIRQVVGRSRPAPYLSAAARRTLMTHRWVGGHDELAGCIERALILCEGAVIKPAHLALDDTDGASRSRDTILRSLEVEHGVRASTAARLGIRPSTLRYRLAAFRKAGFRVHRQYEW